MSRIFNGETVVDKESGKKYHLVRPWFYWGMLGYLLINFFTVTIPNIVTKYIPATIDWFIAIYG